MTRFAENQKGADKTVNHEGGVAFKSSTELELYNLTASFILADKFYEKENEQLTRLKSLVAKSDPMFVLKLAYYARTQLYLRTVPIILLVEVAKQTKDFAKWVTAIIQRPDEIVELLAYYALSNERTDTKKLNKLSNSIKKGIADAFGKFNEYSLAKYNRKSSVTLKDAVFLTHPKNDEKGLIDKIVNDTLETPYTWEVEISAIGKREFDNEAEKEKAVGEKWAELAFSGKMGYMARLRNLNNFMKPMNLPNLKLLRNPSSCRFGLLMLTTI